MKRIFSILVVLYVGSYLIFRMVNAEVWDKDGKTYVIFPTGAGALFYYLYRPLTLIDSKLTSMNFHIGPHQ
jgi:hypothetical protein